MEELLKAGGDPNEECYGSSPLGYAARGDMEIARILIDAGASVNKGSSPMIFEACR